MGDARATELGDADNAASAGDELNRDRFTTGRDRERDRLPRLRSEPAHRRPRELAHVERSERVVGKRDEVEAQPPGAVTCNAIYQSGRPQRAQQTRCITWVYAQLAGQFVGAEAIRGGRQEIEQRCRTGNRCNGAQRR